MWNYSRLSSQHKNYFFSYSLSPFLDANTIWRHSSHGQRELLHLYVLMLLVSMLIWTLACYDLNWITYLDCFTFQSSYMVASMSPQKLCLLSFTYSRTSRIKLGMLIRLKRIYNFCLLHACFVWYYYAFDTLSYTFDHIWNNLLT